MEASGLDCIDKVHQIIPASRRERFFVGSRTMKEEGKDP